MRRSVLSAVLAAGLSLVACSDQPTEVRPPEAAPAPSSAAVVAGCPTTPTSGEILTLVNELLPRSPIRTSLIALINALPSRFQDRLKAAVRRQIFPIIDLILRSYYAGRLNGGISPANLDKVLRLIKLLHCYVGIEPLSLPTTTTTPGSDVVVTVVFPNVQTTVCTPSRSGKLLVPSTAVTTEIGPVAIAIYNLPDAPPPLRTSLDQYPRFYHFSGSTAAGQVNFNTPVTAAVTLREGVFEGSPDNLRLAHNVGPNFGDVEVLPKPDAVPACPAVGSIGGGGLGSFAWAKKLFLPADLHATSTTMVEVPVGGTTKKFSEFGIVEIFSNPGSFAPDGPTESSEEGGTVTRTVLVTSDNETPIKGAPVTFTAGEGSGTVLTPQPVFTGADGKASASWALPEGSGDFTLDVSVPHVDNQPVETDDPPTANVASTPDVAFNPQSLTFTATVPSSELDIVFVGDINVFDNTAEDNANNQQFYRNFATFTGTGPRATQTQVVWYEGLGSWLPQHRASFGAPYTMSDLSGTLAEAGYTFSISTTTSLTAVPADVKVLFIVVPTQTITFAQAAGLRAFVGEGGRLVLVSDNPGAYATYFSSNEGLNALLAQLGADARDAGVSQDCGYVTLPATSLRTHQLTTNAAATGTIDNLTLACATSLVPGEGDEAFLFNSANTTPIGASVRLSEVAPAAGLAAEQPARSFSGMLQSSATDADPAVGSAGPR
jgi:hypothetical protein